MNTIEMISWLSEKDPGFSTMTSPVQMKPLAASLFLWARHIILTAQSLREDLKPSVSSWLLMFFHWWLYSMKKLLFHILLHYLIPNLDDKNAVVAVGKGEWGHLTSNFAFVPPTTPFFCFLIWAQKCHHFAPPPQILPPACPPSKSWHRHWKES